MNETMQKWRAKEKGTNKVVIKVGDKQIRPERGDYTKSL